MGQLHLVLFVILNCISFHCSYEQSPKHYTSLNVKVYQEGEDIYVVNWNDSLSLSKLEGYSENYQDCALEYHCHLLNLTGDTIGYYIGSSQPRAWTFVQTPTGVESLINVQFSVGINPFSSFYSDEASMIRMLRKYEGMEFEPVQLKIGVRNEDEVMIDLILK